MHYFDNNATTPICKKAILAYQKSLINDWHNPSSPYRSGARIRVKIELEREKLSNLLGINKGNLIFTSGATESNNGIFSHFAKISPADSACLISPFEHSSISDAAKYFFGDRVIYLPVNESGLLDLSKSEQILNNKKIVLVSLMAANNETGILQPWKEVACLCAKKGIFFHCDSTQWIGKLPVEDFSLCSSFCASAHKFSGPKGVGFIVMKSPVQLQVGGGQEGSYRGGTENFASIQSMVTAYRDVMGSFSQSHIFSKWRDQFEQNLLSLVPQTKILGKDMPRLWNTSMFVLPKYENLSWVSKLDKLGFLISTGSACSTANQGPSAISRVMQFGDAESKRLIRVSSYVSTHENDWISLAVAFGQAYKQLSTDASQSSVISI